MTIFIIVIHVIVCIGLIAIVLIQRGRGSGLVESFAGVESMFGTKTSAFLTRATTVFSIIFFITCLSLAVLSVRQSRSLVMSTTMEKESAKLPAKSEQKAAEPVKQEPAKAQSETPKQEAPKTE